MNNQKLKNEIPKDKIIIQYLFILNEETYVFFIFNKQNEEIYVLNENEMIFLKILKKKNFKNFIEYTTKELINNHMNVFILDPNKSKLIVNNKEYLHKYDSYLYKLFFDIFKYK